MANTIGIDYYRIVSETSVGEWSQVYADATLDPEELKRTGCVFGAVKLVGDDLGIKGAGLIEKIDKYCSEEKNRGNLAGLLVLLKAEEAEGAFVWVLAEKGGRKIKAGALPGSAIAIVRDGKRVFLAEELGKVVVGEVRQGDILYLGMKEVVDLIDKGIPEAGDDLEALAEKVTAELMDLPGGSGSALILAVKPMVEAGARESETSNLINHSYVKEVEANLAKRIESHELASGRVVGAFGVGGKIAAAKLSWKDLTTKWARASPLPANEGRGKRKKLFLFLGGVFLFALVFSVVIGYFKIKKDALINRYNSVFEPLEKKRVEAENLFGLNPVGARDLLRSVKEEVAAKKGGFFQTEFVDEIESFEKRVEESWSKVSGEQKVSAELFFDLGLVRNGMKGDRMAFDGGNFLVLDQNLGVVAKVAYPAKKQEVILGKGEDQSWLDVAGQGPNNSLLRKEGLVGILSGTKSELTFDSAVVGPVAIDAFTGAVYVLDRGASEIWRFSTSGGTIGERRRWLATGIEADLTGGMDLAIDSDIWVGLENGKVLRFRRGQTERFSLSDVPENFKIKRLAVNSDSIYLAVLDSEKSRIVLFNKEGGAFVKQLLAEEFGEASDLVFVSEKELMVVAGSKLYLVRL